MTKRRRKRTRVQALPKLSKGPSARARERANPNASFKRLTSLNTTPGGPPSGPQAFPAATAARRTIAHNTRPIPFLPAGQRQEATPLPKPVVGTGTYGTMGQRTGAATTGTMGERSRFKKQGNGAGPPIPKPSTTGPQPSARAQAVASPNARFKRQGNGAGPPIPVRNLSRMKPRRKKP